MPTGGTPFRLKQAMNHSGVKSNASRCHDTSCSIVVPLKQHGGEVIGRKKMVLGKPIFALSETRLDDRNHRVDPIHRQRWPLCECEATTRRTSAQTPRIVLRTIRCCGRLGSCTPDIERYGLSHPTVQGDRLTRLP